MADTMNFGPEWLRNLSSEGASTGPKYQLAEFRYGREEMLALFDRHCKAPENLARFHDLYVEKTLTPISLLPITEEENKLWHRGINSDLIMRPGGKAPPPGLQGASLRGRGGSVDRGRGRGRGFFYPRPGYEDIEGKDPSGSFHRSSRSFDRTQMGDRGWAERNGGDPSDWNGSTSPRKEFGAGGPLGGTRGGAAGMDNWRRHRGGPSGGPEEDDGWRQREKWQRSSWREEGGEPPEGQKSQPGERAQGGRSSNWGRGWVDEGLRGRDQDYDGRKHDEMPEWAQADNHEPGSGGSFDASGAFHGSCSDEDEGQGDGGGANRQPEPPADPAKEPPPPQPQLQPQPAKTASSSAMSDAQSLDSIRARHQNFVTKVEPKDTPINTSPPAPKPTEKADDSRTQPTSGVLPTPSIPNTAATGGSSTGSGRQGSEDDMSRLALDSVVKLIEEEDRTTAIRPPSDRDVWYYRDPNGTEQGPFQSSEMLSWYNTGYFQESLLVRRSHEERYTALGQLILATGRVPFFPVPPPLPSPAVESFPYHLIGQMPRMKLPDAEHWNAMPLVEREALMQQKLAMSQAPVLDPMTRLLTQLQQTSLSSQPAIDPAVADPVRALMMMAPQAPPAHHLPHPALQHPLPHALQARNPVLPDVRTTELHQELIRQMETKKAQDRPVVDSLWSGPGRPAWTNGLANVPAAMPAGVLGNVPRWEMKTEDEILAEQQRLVEEQRKKDEELRKREDEERMERERLELKMIEDERRRKEENKLRAILKMPQIPQVPAPQNAFDLFKLQREKEKEEEENRKMLEEQQRKLEELKRLEEAQRKKEEKERRREQEREKKRLVEEEKKRQEEERKRVEREAEEARKQEELALEQQQEQQRRQEEALRCLREQQMKSRVKPWSQPTLPSSSLADIQEQERQRKLQQQREHVLVSQIMEQNREAQEEKNKSSAGMNLKWASAAPRVDHIKSLAEIQVEEQLQQTKQLEKERQERQQLQRDLPANSGIWGASSSLSWNSHGSGGPWGVVPSSTTPTAGFWDDAVSNAKAKTKSPLSLKPKPQNANGNGPKKTAVANNAKSAKPKTKREEAAVMKLFEVQDDEFTNWCSQALYALQAGIDVPTFSMFLRDIDSPYEVKDYVKTYLGETREAAEFARNFLERRSRWRASRRAAQDEDDMCAPAVAINPAATNPETQDNSKKGKKAKKGKMIKVDTKILGFSVTAATDRINVGERETWDPHS